MDDDRIKTHVDGLDEALGGGIPRGHVVLVSGMPGTMKTSLSYSILHRNSEREGLYGLYVSLEQTRESLTQQMRGMGFDGGARVGVIDGAALRKEFGEGRPTVWRNFLRSTIETQQEVQKVDFLVVDSLEAIEVLARFREPREDLFSLFEWLRGTEATTFVLTEAPPEGLVVLSGQTRHAYDATYLADGVLFLKMHAISDLAIQRRLRIVKMRGTAHEIGYFTLVFESGNFSVTRALSV